MVIRFRPHSYRHWDDRHLGVYIDIGIGVDEFRIWCWLFLFFLLVESLSWFLRILEGYKCTSV